MCGIIGGYALTPEGNKYLERVPSANQTLSKRGPDAGDVFFGDKVALGHRRLSIIDLSCAGDQPMHSADDRYTIVFNGEIFNFQDLQREHLSTEEISALRSHSDTEVFLLLYIKFKEKAFELLRGFFAAAIFDHVAGELVVVRDRYGKKPVLYYRDAEKILFASEMKAMLALGVSKEIDWNVLPLYFQLNYIPQPHSLINGIKKLRPGHFLRIKGNEIKEEAYYQLSVKNDRYEEFTYDKAKERLVELMGDAVKMRLISDVPLGAFLSGGIDSSVIVALASQYTDKLKTFSIGYKDNPFFDETAYANLVAKKYKTEHTVFSLSNNDFLEHVYDVLDYIDEPFADSSAIPEFILSYYTRKHVTVALSGDGGDEVFAGYNKHAAELRMRSGSMLNAMVKAGGPIWSLLPKSRSNKLTNTFRQLDRFAKGARLEPAKRYWQWASFMKNKEVMNLFHQDVKQKFSLRFSDTVENNYTSSITTGDFNEVLLADMNLVLLSDMLVKVDLMSMANSLEIRSPFLDHEVVEFAFGLPAEYKIDAGLKKKVVQDAFRSYLPEELYDRPKKGFEIPLLQWLRTELWGLINDDLLEDSFVEEQQIFDVSFTRRLKRQLQSRNPGDSHATMWALVVFQYWWKRYMRA